MLVFLRRTQVGKIALPDKFDFDQIYQERSQRAKNLQLVLKNVN